MYHGERFNGLTHLAGSALAVAGAVTLVASAARAGDPWRIVAVSIFGLMLVLLYAVSTLYHSVRGRAKRVFRKLDHCAIYLLIAGTYTPFALVSLRGAWGWSLFGVVWGAAALGVAAKLFNRLRHPYWSTGLYVAMGWVAVVAIVPLVERVSGAGLAWLVAGGMAYTLGAVVFLFDNRIRYAHFVWHLFVIAGSACHFCAALWHSSAIS
jgi:hemolysin III